MDMKKHMLIYFFISMLVGRENEWSSYKMAIIKFENEVVVFGIVQGQPKNKNCLWNCLRRTIWYISKKSPIYQFLKNIHHWN